MIRLAALGVAVLVIVAVGVVNVGRITIYNPVPEVLPHDFVYPGMLPDHPLYVFKSIKYNLQGFFIFGDEERAQWYLKLADKRLAEFRALVEKGNIDLAIQQLNQATNFSRLAQQHFDQFIKSHSNLNVEELARRLKAQGERQQLFLSQTPVLLRSHVTVKQALVEAGKGVARAEAVLPQVAPASTRSVDPPHNQ